MNFIFYYGTSFFTAKGIAAPFITTVITDVVNVTSTIPGLIGVELFGRRPLLFWGAIGLLRESADHLLDKEAPDADRIHAALNALASTDPDCRLAITGGLNRPPMERTGATVALFERARTFARALGFSLNEAATGGGSDGNFTAALGTPTLDGMGPVGEGAHAAHESLLTAHLIPRTALLAAMIASS